MTSLYDVTLRDGNHALRHQLTSKFVSDYCKVAMPFFTKSMLIQKKIMSRGDLINALRRGGFSEASTSTGDNWNVIFNKRIAPKLI